MEEHPDDRHLFDAIMEGVREELDTPGVRLELAANDAHVQAYAALALLNREYHCDALRAEGLMRQYGLAPWHIESAVLRAAQMLCSDQETTEAIDNALADAHLQRTLQWLKTNRLTDVVVAQDYYDDLKNYLTETYVLPPAISALILGHCRYGLHEERYSHGEA